MLPDPPKCSNFVIDQRSGNVKVRLRRGSTGCMSEVGEVDSSHRTNGTYLRFSVVRQGKIDDHQRTVGPPDMAVAMSSAVMTTRWHQLR